VPYSPSASTWAAGTAAEDRPHRAQEARSAAVFRSSISSTSPPWSSRAAADRSICWPAHHPGPAGRLCEIGDRPYRLSRVGLRKGGVRHHRNASVSRASPARIAVPSPNTLWESASRRRKSSSSIAAGRRGSGSTCEYTRPRQANGRSSLSSPPGRQAAATGAEAAARASPRSHQGIFHRLPEGDGIRDASDAKVPTSTPRPKPRRAGDRVGRRHSSFPKISSSSAVSAERPPGFRRRSSIFRFGLVEALSAHLGEAHPLLEQADRLLEWRLSRLEPFHDGFEPLQRLFEGRVLPFTRHRATASIPHPAS